MTSDILLQRQGCAGIVTLNRPQALNALSLAMIEALTEQLNLWQTDPDIAHIIIHGAGERAFCAGGDIRSLYALRAQPIGLRERFFQREYSLNARIRGFRKPWISLLDGVVMGGGAGVSIHGDYRIATPRTRFAMPETAIGFFPDVGASWFLPRFPGSIGVYLGLTGTVINATDLLYCGAATHFVASDRLDDLYQALTQNDDITAILAAHAAMPPQESALAAERKDIDAVFSATSLVEILDRLDQTGSPRSQALYHILAARSPMALAVTRRLLDEGAKATSFEQMITLEYRLARHLLRGHDLYEGIRAAIIDKDRQPLWRPACVADLDTMMLDHLFTTDPGEGDSEYATLDL